MPQLTGVAVGAFADPDFPMPAQAVWAAESHRWLTLPEHMPVHAQNPPSKSAPSAENNLERTGTSGGRESGPARSPVLIVPYEARHFAGVDALWRETFPADPEWNRADVEIPEKMRFQPGLFFIAEARGEVIGTTMGGYDGHRGWLYAVAVKAACRGAGVGSALIAEAEARLKMLGCQKINLQIREGNDEAAAFYRRRGYELEFRTSMGKRSHSQ